MSQILHNSKILVDWGKQEGEREVYATSTSSISIIMPYIYKIKFRMTCSSSRILPSVHKPQQRRLSSVTRGSQICMLSTSSRMPRRKKKIPTGMRSEYFSSVITTERHKKHSSFVL